MSNTAIPKPAGVKRIVYKEIVPGDRRKFEAKSNDAEGGGGARDLRFSPYETFRGVFERLFPNRDAAGVYRGALHWIESGAEKTSQAAWFPPTVARPFEGRLANVDKCLPKTSLPSAGAGITILLITQREDGSVWVDFTTSQSFLTGGWHQAVSEPILGCLDASRRPNISTCGFVDFETKEDFCNGNQVL